MSRNPLTETEILEFCRAKFGQVPDDISHPGGAGRKTVILSIGGKDYTLSKRASEGRAALEATALRALEQTGSVPKLIEHSGNFVLQSVLAGDRLTRALELGTNTQRVALLTEASDTLIGFQVVARKSGLLNRVPKIGQRANWHRDFASSPVHLATFLDIALDTYSMDQFAALVSTRDEAFVKWDARPGNAYVLQDRSLWFDWEHCGIGSVEDDLVWLFADEWSPIAIEVQRGAISKLASLYGLDEEQLSERFAAKVLLHSCIRLGLIYRRKGDGEWWNPAEALAHDRVGVTAGHVRRLCSRALKICASNADFGPLTVLFEGILQRLK